MSDCDRCVHTYKSGNCLLGHNQTFTTIGNKVVISSLEPDCHNFVLGYCVRDSSESVKDSSNSAKDTNENIFTDSNLKDRTFDLLFNLCHAFLGIAVTSAFFLLLNEIPTVGFVLTSSILFLLSSVAFRLFKRGAFGKLIRGDDE